MPQKRYTIEQGSAKDKPLYNSELGTQVYGDLTFTSDTGAFETQTYAAVLITVSQTKNIVRTEIQERDFTVKEYIGLGDYQITITGVITGANGVHPADKIAKLRKMLNSKESIPVASAWLQNLGIFNITIESYELPQDAGGYSYQTFSINALSDRPVEFLINGM